MMVFMSNSISKNARLLTYMGAVPFYLAALAYWFGIEASSAICAFKLYGLLIISFICGIHWCMAVSTHANKMNWMLYSSNVIALLAFANWVFAGKTTHLLIMAALFGALLFIDLKIHIAGLTDRWYINMRKQVTVIVLIPIVLLAFL